MMKKHDVAVCDNTVDGLFEILCYDDGVERQVAVVRGEKTAQAVVDEQTKGSWLGGKLVGFHYRPLYVVDGRDLEGLWLYDEKEVYVRVSFKGDEESVVSFFERGSVRDPAAWAGGIVDTQEDGTVIVRYGAIVADFGDCKTEADCKAAAIRLAVRAKEEVDMRQKVKAEIIGSLDAFVATEISFLRLANEANAMTKSLMFQMADTWRNGCRVSTVKAAEGKVRWYYAVDLEEVTMTPSDKLLTPLPDDEIRMLRDMTLSGLFDYALERVSAQIGFKDKDKAEERCYTFSFFTASGLCVSVYVSAFDPEIAWFVVNGVTMLESHEVFKRWRDIIEGLTKF